MVEAVLLLSGFGVGLLGAILGVGGGVFLVPLLVVGAGFDAKQAIGISLFCIMGTSLAATPKALNQGLSSLRLALFLEIFAISGTLISSHLVYRINDGLLMKLFGCFLVLVSGLMVLIGHKNQETNKKRAEMSLSFTPKLGFLAIMTLFIGVLTGLFGVGGGILMVPVLVIIGGVSVSFAAQTSLFLMMASGAVALSVHFTKGEISAGMAMVSFLGVFPGGRLGIKIRGGLNETTLRGVFCLFAIVVGLVLILRPGV